MMEQVKEHYQDLRIQLETKVNYYEREVEVMKRNFEEERKELEQEHRLEVGALQGQKADLEALYAKSQEVIQGLREQLRAAPCCAQALCGLAQQLQEELHQRHRSQLQQMRREAEDELSQKLSRLEAQHAARCESLSLRHQCEKEQLLQTHLTRVGELAAQLALEKERRKEREKEILEHCQKQQLRLQAAMSEEQAQACRSFALEREKLESAYRAQVEGLAREAQALRALLGDRAAAVDGEQDTRKPTPPCAGREQPPALPDPSAGGGTREPAGDEPGQRQAVDAMQSPAPAPGCRGASESCSGNHQGPPRAAQALEGRRAASTGEPGPSARAHSQELPELATQDVWLTLFQTLEPEWSLPTVEEPASSLNGELAPAGGQGQASEGLTGCGDSALQAWLQHSREAARRSPSLSHCESPGPQGTGLKHLVALRETEAAVASEGEVSEVEAKLLKLEDVVRALEKEAESRENDRIEFHRLSEENTLLKSDLGRIQQELEAAESKTLTQREEIEVLKRDKEKACFEIEELNTQSQKYKDELSQLSCRVLQLEGDACTHQAQNEKNLTTIQLLRQRLEEVVCQEQQQEEQVKQLKDREGRGREAELLLQNVELLLQEKVEELRGQLEKNTRSDLLLKELYVENAHLMKVLQVTEEKQRGAEKKNRVLEEKVRALNKLICKIAPASLSV